MQTKGKTMAEFGKVVEYVKPEREDAPNPFIDSVKQYTDKGVDTAFEVAFASEDFSREKLQIQKAVNVHGFSAREVARQGDPEKDKKVVATFVIRPARKRKGDSDSTSDSEDGIVEDEATGK